MSSLIDRQSINLSVEFEDGMRLQCDVNTVLAWAPAFCPASAALVTAGTAGNLDDLPANALTWQEASELLYFLPFLLFRFPKNQGAGLIAIVASSFTPPKATTPKESLGIPNNKSDTTTATTNLTVKNRFARSFSQLVASQLVPGDLITMAKSQGILTNMGVDYVVVFRFATTGKHTLCQQSMPGHTQADTTRQQTRKRPESASRSSPKLSLLSVLLPKSAMATTTPS
jgi:hypothetical protein